MGQDAQARRCTSWPPWTASNERAEAAAGAADRGAPGRAGRARWSRSGAWPSSRAPTTCARRRRSRSSRGCWRAAPPCAPTTRRPWRRRGAMLGDRVTYCAKSYEAVEGADALVLVTEWNEFREPDFPRIKSLMRQPAVFDGRNIYKPADAAATWASTTRASAAGEGPRHRRRRLHRQPRRARAARRRPRGGACSTTSRAGHRAAVPADVTLVRGRPRRRGGAARARWRARRRCMHFAGLLQRRPSRCASRPPTTA